MSENQTTILGEELETKSPDQDTSNKDKESSSFADQASEENYLDNLVGEGKKYTSIEEAAKALAKKAHHADSFIETLKNEKVELEKQISSAKKVDDILAALNDRQDTSGITEEEKPASTETQHPDVRETVKQLLEEQANERAENKKLELIKSNQKKAWELLSEEFDGADNAKLVVKNYIGNDETKADIVNQMGSYQPGELVEFLKVRNKTTDFNPATTETLRVVSEFDTAPVTLTWADAQKVKKENPRLYRSHKFQRMLHEAADKNTNFFNK